MNILPDLLEMPDKLFVHSVPGTSATLPSNLSKPAKSGIIKKIEDILGNINNTAASDGCPKLIIRNQKLWSNCIYDLDRLEYLKK